ncbi:O-antigen ligase family protein [Halomonas kalidii]|uniref:O-antigen ligase family protein n=1 Tax=Halomonas kalidii TaxID=3043293 RepID=A0ABT6VKF5_9GAMM|nr:O-antigen ligase family protein [Halomonas kalidii]MDI5934165.1 O-antigen ligase family protein [Halomonas kalidii]
MPPTLIIEYVRRPMPLLVLAGLFIFLSLFDYRQLTSLPLLRTPSALLGLILALAFTLSRALSYRLHRGPQAWLFLLIGATLIAELLRLLSVDGSQFRYYMQWLQVFILFIILLDLAQDPRALPILWGSVVVAAVFLALLALLGGTEMARGRSGYDEINLNHQAYLFTLGLMTLIWLLMEKLRALPLWHLLAGIAGVALLLLAILKTGSRGAFLSMVAGLVLLLWLGARKRNASAYAYLLPPLILLVVWQVFTNDLVVERLFNTVAGQEDNSRLVIWSRAGHMLAQQPWIGHGPDFMRLLGGYYQPGVVINTHNGYLQVLLAFGIPAFIFWLGLVGSALWRCWRVRSTPAGALFISVMAVTLMFGMTSDLAFDRFFWVTLALAANVGAYQWSPSLAPLASHVPGSRVTDHHT